MRRGTTPTFQFSIDSDLTGWDVYATFGQHGHALTTWKPVDIEATDTGCIVTVMLTQAETLRFRAEVPAQAQIRAFSNGVAVATGIWEFDVEPIILEGEIPQDIQGVLHGSD